MKKWYSILPDRVLSGNPAARLWMATLSLAAFTVLGQILCDSLEHTGQAGGQLLRTLLCLALGGAVYGVVRLLIRRHWSCKAVLAILFVPMVLFWVLCSLMLGCLTTLRDYQVVEYVDESDVLYANSAQVSIELLEHCRLVGEGESLFRYPQMEKEDIASGEDWKLYNNSIRERNRMKAVYERYRINAMVPVLSYAYGLWVLALYLALCAFWLSAAIRVVPAIRSRFYTALYLMIGYIPAFFILWSTLTCFGLLPLGMAHPYAANFAVNLLCFVCQFAMLAISDRCASASQKL